MAIFDDMLTSSRGPGVIGIVLGLFVLLGFGGLFLMVTDPRFMGKDGTPIGVQVKQGDEEIESFKFRIEQAEKDKLRQDQLEEIVEEIAGLILKVKGHEPRLVEVQAEKAAATEAIQGVREEWREYRIQYRDAVRAGATGDKHERLELLSGKVYEGVEVRVVDAVGMQFKHKNGGSRAPWQDLPEEMQDYFQFSDDEEAKLRDEEGDIDRLTGLEKEIVDTGKKIKLRKRQLADNQEKVGRQKVRISELERLGTDLVTMILAKQQAIRAESLKKLRQTERLEADLKELQRKKDAVPGATQGAHAVIRKLERENAKLDTEISELESKYAELCRRRREEQREEAGGVEQ